MVVPLDGATKPGKRWGAEQRRSMESRAAACSLTFNAGHLLALRLTEEVQLVGDGFQHLDKVGQEKDDVDIVVGEVSATADPLGPLHVGTAQQGYRGPLMHVLRVQPRTQTRKGLINPRTSYLLPVRGGGGGKSLKCKFSGVLQIFRCL